MIKTTIAIISLAGAGVGATTSPTIASKYNPVTSVDMQISYLDIKAETEGVSLTMMEDADFAINLKLRNGHTVKVRF